jgi:hypothetical protein
MATEQFIPTAIPSPPPEAPPSVTLATIAESETQQLQSQAAAMLTEIEAMPVKTPEQFKSAGELAVSIAKRREEIKQRLKVAIADPAYQVYKRAYDLWKQVDRPYEQAESILSRKVATFHAEQERIRREQEAALRARQEQINRTNQAKALAAELSKFDLDEAKLSEMIGSCFAEVTEGGLRTLRNLLATKAREAAEAKAKAEQDERFLQEAIKREQEGDKETAELIVAAANELPPPEADPVAIPVIAPAPVEPISLVPATPKVEGLSFSTTWKWEVTDISQVPREYMKLDESAIGGVVRAMKDKTSIPGIRVYSVQTATKTRK